MIERLNFFDFYAYLLPGLTWIGLASAPFLVLGDVQLPEAWASALAGVAAAYVAGHLLYRSMHRVPVFDVRDKNGRMPSQKLLDADSKIPSALKERVRVRSLRLWNIDLESTTAEKWTKESDGARQTVFELARVFLTTRKQQAYAEQMQGMYTLTRGLAGAFLLAGESWAGWCIGTMTNGACSCRGPFGWATAAIGTAWVLVIFGTALPFVGGKPTSGSAKFLFLTLAVTVLGAVGANKFGDHLEPLIAAAAVGSIVISLCIFRPAMNELFDYFAGGVYRGLAATGAEPEKSPAEG